VGDELPVCRAYFKIREVSSRFSLPLTSSTVAIDVGAAPGGWTSFLADAGCSHVIAVDPGKLELGSAPNPAIEHLQMKLQDALPLLLPRASSPADLYCCDMNAAPPLVVDLFLQAVPLLRAGARVVLTFKNVYPKKHAWQQAHDLAISRLAEHLTDLSSVQLFANTSRESTVLGSLKGAG